MSNIIPFNRGKSSGTRKRIQDAAKLRISDCHASGQAFDIFKKKFIQSANINERFSIGMALFHEGIQQIIFSREHADSFSDEDIRCLVAIVVDSILSQEQMEI